MTHSRSSKAAYVAPRPGLPLEEPVPSRARRPARREWALGRRQPYVRGSRPPELVRVRAQLPLLQTSELASSRMPGVELAVALPSEPRPQSGESRAADRLDHTTGVLLGAIAGAVDAAGWVCLAGLLPSHLTASLVILGASLGEHESADVSARLAMIPAFVLSVAFVKWCAGLLGARKLPVLAPLLTLLSAALGVFALAGVLSDALLADDPRVLFGVGGIGVASMAVQNTIMRLCLPGLNPTTVMTGNLTQLVLATVDLTSRPVQHDKSLVMARWRERDALRRLHGAAAPLLGFLCGAVVSGYFASQHGLLSLTLPFGLATLTAALAWRRVLRARSVREQHAGRTSRSLFSGSIAAR